MIMLMKKNQEFMSIEERTVEVSKEDEDVHIGEEAKTERLVAMIEDFREIKDQKLHGQMLMTSSKTLKLLAGSLMVNVEEVEAVKIEEDIEMAVTEVTEEVQATSEEATEEVIEVAQMTETNKQRHNRKRINKQSL